MAAHLMDRSGCRTRGRLPPGTPWARAGMECPESGGQPVTGAGVSGPGRPIGSVGDAVGCGSLVRKTKPPPKSLSRRSARVRTPASSRSEPSQQPSLLVPKISRRWASRKSPTPCPFPEAPESQAGAGPSGLGVAVGRQRNDGGGPDRSSTALSGRIRMRPASRIRNRGRGQPPERRWWRLRWRRSAATPRDFLSTSRRMRSPTKSMSRAGVARPTSAALSHWRVPVSRLRRTAAALTGTAGFLSESAVFSSRTHRSRWGGSAFCRFQ